MRSHKTSRPRTRGGVIKAFLLVLVDELFIFANIRDEFDNVTISKFQRQLVRRTRVTLAPSSMRFISLARDSSSHLVETLDRARTQTPDHLE